MFLLFFIFVLVTFVRPSLIIGCIGVYALRKNKILQPLNITVLCNVFVCVCVCYTALRET